jgi:hypothetical protein
VAHVTGLDQVGDGAGGVLDGHLGVEPGRAVDVDVVGAQALQRVGQGRLHCGRARVVTQPAAVGAALRAEFHAELVAVARACGQRLAQQHLVVAHAVEIAGVEQGDTRVERRMDGRDAFAAIGAAVHVGHAHATEAEGGD